MAQQVKYLALLLLWLGLDPWPGKFHISWVCPSPPTPKIIIMQTLAVRPQRKYFWRLLNQNTDNRWRVTIPPTSLDKSHKPKLSHIWPLLGQILQVWELQGKDSKESQGLDCSNCFTSLFLYSYLYPSLQRANKNIAKLSKYILFCHLRNMTSTSKCL